MTIDKNKLIASFTKRFNHAPEAVSRAPGRVNLIGEHTDYNEGFVMPVTVDREVAMAGRLNGTALLRIHSIDFNQSVELPIDQLTPQKELDWSNYTAGVVKHLQKAGHTVKGMDLAFTGDVPRGAGLSSSAALELCSCVCIELLNGIELDPIERVKMCQQVENQYVGMNCGIMDQFISNMGDQTHCLVIDCRSLEFERIPLQLGDCEIVIADTRSPHKLTSSAYNERRSQCEEGVKLIGKALKRKISALRDVSVEEIQKLSAQLPEPIRSRCQHVVSENARVQLARELLKAGKLEEFGLLMNQSHISLRVDYEVSSVELDELAWTAWSMPGVLGSRMTGAGFGGCTVTLVRSSEVETLKSKLDERYYAPRALEPRVYRCMPSAGAIAEKI
ncbi:galactokinase [Candidatus Sumerlaeota bacterium]|nr:galactokinase [Candidatus Sumerlaeota bacterium]